MKGNERISARVKEIVGRAAERAGVSLERTLRELAAIAFSDISKAVTWGPSVQVREEYEDGAAPSFAVEVTLAPVHAASELEAVVAAQARHPNSGLFVLPDPFTNAYRVEITSLAARFRLPAVYAFRFFTELGGLLSYGNDLNDNFRRAAIYADRILKGDKPSELPVQAPVKFELVINLKTAKALGLDVPLFLQQLADKVIE
jgi:ABC-type uncharacterized transport system substrate-binding protein